MSTGVLIVDDSHFMRNLLRQILEQDYRIVGEASNGAEAVKLYKDNDPDVVMMDIVMPKANGIKATAAIKKIDPDAKVIMCTSVGQREKMKLAVKAGADGYVTKPFEEESVRKALKDVVESESSAA